MFIADTLVPRSEHEAGSGSTHISGEIMFLHIVFFCFVLANIREVIASLISLPAAPHRSYYMIRKV